MISFLFALGCMSLHAKSISVVDSFGFDPVDSTRYIQAAIDSGAEEIVIEKKDVPWVITPIKGRSNLHLILEKGVKIVAKEGEFKGVADCMFKFAFVTNVFIDGRGATVQMRKRDYQNPPYAKAEWRSGFDFLSSENVTIQGVRVMETGGDGLYFGDQTKGHPCRNLVVRRCIFESNHRQGVSVISADNLLIEDCIMRGTDGTAPKDGLDFEPNKETDQLTRCVVRRCRFENNKGAGIDIHLTPSRSSTLPIDITVEDCYSTGNRYGTVYSGFTGDDLVSGRVRFIRCVFERECGAAVGVFNKPARSVALRFEDCCFVSNCAENQVESDILFDMQGSKTEVTDGVTFAKLKIVQSIRRPWFQIRGNGAFVQGVRTVFGDVEVTDADGKVCSRTLDSAFWSNDVLSAGVRIVDLLKN